MALQLTLLDEEGIHAERAEYGAERAEYGEVFTRRWVAEVLLDLVGYTPDRNLGALRLLEPCVGSGAFLRPVVQRLARSARTHGTRFEELGDAVRGFDLQEGKLQASRAAVVEVLTVEGCGQRVAEQLAATWLRRENFLLDDQDLGVDVVVGNPPYVRIEDVSPALASRYRTMWSTMSGRADLYIGFYERCLRSLQPGGKLGFICADRWMRNQYGTRLRRLVASQFAVDCVWEMHDVDAFEEPVAAYPAITVLSRRRQGSAVVAATDASFGERGATRLAHWARSGRGSQSSGPGYHAHRLPRWFDGSEMWPQGSPAQLALIKDLRGRFGPLHTADGATRVGIGIATGADAVFVLSDPSLVDAGRALPLATGDDLAGGSFSWGGRWLANPWERDGSLADLARYPKLRRHLESVGPQLRRRHTAKKNLTRWYRTIDKVKPGLADRPKLLMRDLGSRANPVLELGGHYPHHNLYYIVSDSWDLEVLGGILLSRIAQVFVEAYSVRMRGGTLRFQAQYLKQIRVPDPRAVGVDVADALRGAFRSRDVEAATAAAAVAYGIDSGEYGLL